MKKKLYRHLGNAALIFFGIICLSQRVNAQLSDAERMERCTNNKNRLAELETQLSVVDAELSQTMSKKEIEDARNKMVFVKKVGYTDVYSSNRELYKIAAQYNFDWEKCMEYFIAEHRKPPICLKDLEKIIADKIDKAVSLQNKKPELLNKKSEIDQQIASHRNNLIALRCNETSITQADDFDYSKLSGTWGSNFGPMQLNVSKGSASGSWNQGSGSIGQITGGSFDPNTKILSLTYSQKWMPENA